MRISDWSSDVCSSDLQLVERLAIIILVGFERQVRMYVDESWQQGRVAEVDRSRAVRNRRIAADTDDPPGLDHHDRIAAHPFARRIQPPRGPQTERSRRPAESSVGKE